MARGWLRGVITFVVAAALIMRVAMPTPAQSEISSSASLALLGATLCHHDDGDQPTVPISKDLCDHCDMCSGTVPILRTPGAMPVPKFTAEVIQHDELNPASKPRAPPARANKPRAPPAQV